MPPQRAKKAKRSKRVKTADLSPEELERRRILRKERNHRFYVNHKAAGQQVHRTTTSHVASHIDQPESESVGGEQEVQTSTSTRTALPLPSPLIPVLEPPRVFSSGVKNGIPIPLTPDLKIIAPLEALNEMLRNWGYTNEDPTEFVKSFRDELKEVVDDPAALAEFIKEKETWVEAGDLLLDTMQYFLGELIIDHMVGEGMRWLWMHVSSAAFKIQYKMTVVEVHLDSLDLDRAANASEV